MNNTVADDLLDVLVQAGVHRIYGLVGDSLNAFSDTLRRSGGSAKGGIDWIHVRNGEAACSPYRGSRSPPPSRHWPSCTSRRWRPWRWS